MAAAHCATAAATVSFVFPPARKHSVIVCAIPIRFPSKPVKRKNYLRPKILKTLTKPCPIPHETTPANPLIPIESPLEQQKQQHLDFPSDQFVIQEVQESDGIEEQEPPEFCSDQIVSHYVEGSESIEGKPGALSDQFSGERMKAFHSDIPFDQFVSEEYDESDRLEQLPELDVDRFSGENIGVSEVREFSQSEETRSSSELVKPIAGNPFSSFSMIQIGLCFVGACVIDSIWSIWLAKKINSFKKDQNLGIVDRNNKPKPDLLLKENNYGNNKEKLELLLKENNDGNSKPNPEHLLKEKNDGNNKPKPEVLLKENNDGGNKPKSEQLWKENGNSVGNMNEGAVEYESEMNKKISEIRALAREAREREKLQSEENNVVEDVEEYEDDDDLILRNSEKSIKKHPLSPKGLSTEKASKTLMFKKKLRLTSLGIDAEDTKPKDFTGRQDHVTVVKTNEKLHFDVLDRDEKLDVPIGELLNNVSPTSLEENKGRKVLAKETARNRSSSRKKIVKEKAQTKRRVTKSEQLKQSRSGVLGSSSMSLEEEDKGVKLPVEESTQIQGSRKMYVKDKRRAKPRLTESKQSAVQEKVKPVSLEAQIFRNFVPSKDHDILDSVPKKHDDLNGNGGLKIKEVGTGKANNGFSGQKSYANTDDFWWSSLPYVLAIVLRSDGGGSKGLYTLRSTSQGRGDAIYRVAFEDHTDATNFCHILESYFEELIGFSAEITSIPTKELEEALKAKTMKVLVVKKGQLESYSGQPLPEVEKALKSSVS